MTLNTESIGTRYNALEAAVNAVRAGETSWDALTEAGKLAQRNMDVGRWIIGDLAVMVKTRYREDRLGSFAKEIQVDVARVREYRRVCAFWEMSHRQHFFDDERITYSHFREAMRLKDIEHARAFLDACAENEWTVEAARVALNEHLGKPSPATNVAEFEAVAQRWDGGVFFEIAADVYMRINTTALFEVGREYHFRVRESA